METILDCFFENFGLLDRDSLHARYKRRETVEYFNTMIEGCCRGEECSPEKSLREAIVGILRYHEKMRNLNGTVCMMGKFHNILYVAVKLCYDWQLKDTEIVAALLDHIYSCEKTFERIFVGALFGTRAPHYIAGWKSDFDDQEENLRAMVYYIDHATTASLEYQHETLKPPVRFVDVPIESCGRASALKITMQLYLPDKMHILLRFGALLIPSGSPEDNEIIKSLLDRLQEFNHVYPYNIVACLQLVLRVLPCVCVAFGEGGDFCGKEGLVAEKYADLIEDGVLPLRRCGIEPPELKHLCRCVVRERLWKNYELPNGIRSLPIPGVLKRYLDIMED